MICRTFMTIRYIVIFSYAIQICVSESHSPLVFTNWPPTKAPSFRHQIMMALRPMMRQPSADFLYKRAPQLLPQPQRLVRPMKLAVAVNTPYFLKNHLNSAYKRPTPAPLASSSLTSSQTFQSSPPGPNTGEYVFENPFSNNLLQTTSKSPAGGSTIRLNADRFNPIHTIPAPNLSQLETFPAWQTKSEQEYFEKPYPVFLPQRPNDIHQYQVTEETNDHTINNLISGTRKLYAPDPDPSLPAIKIKPSTDPFSQPSNTNFQTLNLFGTLPPSALIQSPSTSIQFDSSNSPLQQKFLQQQSIVQGMPLSVYNPTYLVTQSNQLLDQHKRHLFQPAPKDKSNIAAASNLSPIQSVASPGQIMTAAKDKIGDVNSYESLPSNPSPLIRENNSVASSVSDSTTLTEKEVSDLINFGKLYNNLDQNSFIASSYYDSFPDPQTDFDITQHQRDNDEILRQANEDIAARKASVTIGSTTGSALQEHQQHLDEQFENVPLRIIVPEPTNEQTETNVNEVKRFDNFSNESNTEVDSYSDIDNRVTMSEVKSEHGSAEIVNDEKAENVSSYDYYSNDSTEDMVHSS
ncbi:uncharacterized protein LOC119067840 isoform X2 [Bradysia coprophila]|uniref:uncharacterized protein LOC119067840 isoform X2 n=1 Tax=Bradysia coprophila TaxID=38358 RepID=UPI00187D9486|nr:uncharacterized protein LOC119067840 isoform X2 [Bradysia coprophila]